MSSRGGLTVMQEMAQKGIPVVWLNPGADDPAVVERAKALGSDDCGVFDSRRRRDAVELVITRSWARRLEPDGVTLLLAPVGKVLYSTRQTTSRGQF